MSARPTRSINLRGRTQAPAAAAPTRAATRRSPTRAAAPAAARARSRSRSPTRAAGGAGMPAYDANNNWFLNPATGRAAKIYQTTSGGQLKTGADGKPLATDTFWKAHTSGALRAGFSRYPNQGAVGQGAEAAAARQQRETARASGKSSRVKARQAFYRLSGGSRRAVFVGKFQPGPGDLGPFTGRGATVEQQEQDAKDQARDAAITGGHLKGTLSTGSTRKPVQRKSSDRFVLMPSVDSRGRNTTKRLKVGGDAWNRMIVTGGDAARRELEGMEKLTYEQANARSAQRSEARRVSKATMDPEERAAANRARLEAVRGRKYEFCVYKTAPGAALTGKAVGVWPQPTVNAKALATSLGLRAGASDTEVRDYLLKAVRDGRLGYPAPGVKCSQSLLQ